jgi:hypothetical protein
MVAQGLNNNRTSPPTRENITELTRIATNTFPAQMIRNAWRHAPYSWFPVVAGGEEQGEVEAEEEGTSESDDDDNESYSGTDALYSTIVELCILVYNCRTTRYYPQFCTRAPESGVCECCVCVVFVIRILYVIHVVVWCMGVYVI